MSAARARSRAEKAIFDIASSKGTTLCFLISMCSTTSTSSSDFFGFIFSIPSFQAERRVEKSRGNQLQDNASGYLAFARMTTVEPTISYKRLPLLHMRLVG